MPANDEVDERREAGIQAVKASARHAVEVPRMHVEEVVLVSRYLPERDRALVRAVYERGLPLKAVAAATDSRPKRLQSRLRRVVTKLRSPLFRLVLREQGSWPADRRAIAQGFVLHGRTQRAIARSLNLSLHRVRMEIEHLKALAGVTRLDGEE